MKNVYTIQELQHTKLYELPNIIYNAILNDLQNVFHAHKSFTRHTQQRNSDGIRSVLRYLQVHNNHSIKSMTEIFSSLYKLKNLYRLF